MLNQFLWRFSLAVLAPLAILKPDAGHCETLPATPAAAPAAAEERLAHISVTTMGSKGSPVILIPGLASPRATWDGIAPKLAETHRVYLVQVNGFAGDDAGQNLQAGLLNGVVADIDAYIASHRLAGAMVIGHSLGGLTGMMLAKAHPGDLSKLMIVDSLPWIGVLMTPPGVEASVPMLEPRARAMRDAITASHGQPANPAAIEAQARGLAIKPDSVAKIKIWMAAADSRVTAQGFYDGLTTDLRGDLPAITTPVTVVYPWSATGRGGQMTGAFYRAQYKAAPRADFVAIGDSGHFVMLDQQQVFEAAVTAFLSTN